MARTRRVSNVICFTPPTFLEGVAQVGDVFGMISSQTQSPRVIYVHRKTPVAGKYIREYQVRSVNSALARDVRAIGSDVFTCIRKHDEKLRRGV
jgi:hypothetical protein